MSDVLIRCENVSKRFCRDLRKSLWYGVKDIAREVIFDQTGRLPASSADVQLRPNEFWANKDISFEVKRGECLGLIGHNGAGKTTLLKMLNGLIKPDTGRIEMRGKIGALIALGAGFNPILTGRENIFVNGAILGMSKRQIADRLEEIVDFAELAEFIESPVGNYSSGMQVRLGFSVATIFDPNILIIDEVLAVGDVRFRVKCSQRLKTVRENGCAVVLVSHNLTDISNHATNVHWLDQSSIRLAGLAREVIPQYLGFDKVGSAASAEFSDNSSQNFINVRSLGVYPDAEASKISVTSGFQIRLAFSCRHTHISLDVTFAVSSVDGTQIFRAGSVISELCEAKPGGRFEVTARVPPHLLNDGTYNLSLIIGESQSHCLLDWPNVIEFDIANEGRGANYYSPPGLLRPLLDWKAICKVVS
jgi:lipopolysaccharide transport system ATP-binding protein